MSKVLVIGMRDERNYVYAKQYIVDRLHHLGFRELVDAALRELPDPVNSEQLSEWGMRHGVSKDEVISRIGGSP